MGENSVYCLPAIAVACYLLIELVKAVTGGAASWKSFYPVLSAFIGMGLGAAPCFRIDPRMDFRILAGGNSDRGCKTGFPLPAAIRSENACRNFFIAMRKMTPKNKDVKGKGGEWKMGSVISTVFTACATVASGMILFFLQRFLTRQQKKEEQRDAAKAKETALLFRSLDALGKLSMANGVALRDGKTNGELTLALSEWEKVQRQMYDYLISSHAKNSTGI